MLRDDVEDFSCMLLDMYKKANANKNWGVFYLYENKMITGYNEITNPSDGFDKLTAS